MDREKLIPYAGREQSSVKHFLLESYLERLIMIAALGGYKRIAYVDAFAGPWKSAREDLSDTSFARAVTVMEGCRAALARRGLTVSFRALFVERDPETYQRLKAFAEARSTAAIEIKAVNEDFAESAESVSRWIRGDELVLVLIDPTGWKRVIAPETLAPLLRRRNVELLINVMSNFISLASGHASQEQNLRELVGDAYPELIASGAGSEEWMRAYLQRLRAVAGGSSSGTRLRATCFPVEFPDKDRVFYYLTYGTHHATGMIVFLEESEKGLRYQREVKFAVRQQQRETDTGIQDMFGDALHSSGGSTAGAGPDTRSAWLSRLPEAGMEIWVDEAAIADMAEECGCLISELQDALRELIDEGILENLDARRKRRKNVVDYKKGETIRRLK